MKVLNFNRFFMKMLKVFKNTCEDNTYVVELRLHIMLYYDEYNNMLPSMKKTFFSSNYGVLL